MNLGLLASLGPAELVAVVLSLLLGGVLKGFTGAGAPIAAIPVMAAFVDLRIAVMVMLMPNLLTNLRQAVQFRRSQPERGFLWPYVAGGGVGVLIGTWLLTGLPGRWLDVLVACAALAYVLFRIGRPDWRIERPAARAGAVPAGVAAGILQGATGLSAPATMSFLNAVRLTRPEFIATVAVVFCVFSALHITVLWAMGHFTAEIAVLSSAALLPVLIGMEVGSRLSRQVPAALFDRLILSLLVLVSAKVLLDL